MSFNSEFCEEFDGVVPEIVIISVFEIYCVLDKTLLQQYFALYDKKYTLPAVINGLNSSDAISIYYTLKIIPYKCQNFGKNIQDIGGQEVGSVMMYCPN